MESDTVNLSRRRYSERGNKGVVGVKTGRGKNKKGQKKKEKWRKDGRKNPEKNQGRIADMNAGLDNYKWLSVQFDTKVTKKNEKGAEE